MPRGVRDSMSGPMSADVFEGSEGGAERVHVGPDVGRYDSRAGLTCPDCFLMSDPMSVGVFPRRILDGEGGSMSDPMSVGVSPSQVPTAMAVLHVGPDVDRCIFTKAPRWQQGDPCRTRCRAMYIRIESHIQ